MAFPAVGDAGTNTIAPPNDHGSKLLAALANGMDTNGNLVSAYIKLGTNVASAGLVRLANAGWITSRNAANTADQNMFQVDATNKIIYGTRMESNSYLSETNTTALRGILGGFAQRYGGGTISDRTMGLFVNVIDNALCKRTAITNVVSSGGLFRVTATAHGASTGDRVMIYGAGGVPNACNAWTVTRIDANTLDLQGSTFAGAYTSGGFVSTGGQIYGAQFTVSPTITRDFGVSGGSAAYGDDVIGNAVYNNGTTKGTSAYNAGSNTGAGGAWLYGMTFDGGYDTGITWSGAMTNFGIDFNNATSFGIGMIRLKNNVWNVGRNNAASANLNLYKVNASDKLEFGIGAAMPLTTAYGFDFNGGTFAGGVIRLPNNNFIVARNNAGSADLVLVGADTTDSLNFGIVTRHAGGLIVSDTKNIQFSTGTGSQIGTAITQKIGFYAATPIAQRAGAAQVAVATTASVNTTPFGYTTAAQADAIVTLLNELRAWAVAQGFIKGAA